MSIGMFDCDLAEYRVIPFNLELMKLSSYYKQRKEMVLLTPFLLPERYQKTFIRKDYDDGIFPNYPIQYDVRCGGLAYSGGKYAPLPIQIEQQKPDTLLYGSVENFFIDREEKLTFRNMTNAEHLRLSLDGKTIWNEYKCQLKNPTKTRLFYIHDPNLSQIEGAAAEVRKLVTNSYKTCRFGNKFPIMVDKEQEFFEWLLARPHNLYVDIKFTGEFSKEGLITYCRLPIPKLVSQKIEYRVDATSLSEEDFLKNRIREIYREAIILRRFNQQILLTYKNNFFKDKRWEKVIELINRIIFTKRSELPALKGKNSLDYDTLYRIISNPNIAPLKKETVDEAREIFMFVKNNHYPLFKDFYECVANNLKEEYGINDW